MRVVRDIYPPRIDLEFMLRDADGTVLREGRRDLRDAAFLAHANRRSGDPLNFGKALLDVWVAREFPQR